MVDVVFAAEAAAHAQSLLTRRAKVVIGRIVDAATMVLDLLVTTIITTTPLFVDGARHALGHGHHALRTVAVIGHRTPICGRVLHVLISSWG